MRAGSVRVALAVSAVVALFVLWPMLGAPFGPRDDYEIAAILGSDRVLPASELPEAAVGLTAADHGRFRPAYYPLRTIEAAIFGGNSTAWHLSRLALVLVSAAALASLLAGLVPVVAVVVLPLVLVAGPQAEAWIMLAPNEAYGVPLLLSGLALWRFGHRWPAVVLLLLAGLTKESFTVFNIAVAAWLAWRHWSPPVAALVVGTAISVCAVAATFLGGEPLYSGARNIDTVSAAYIDIVLSGAGIVAAVMLAPTRSVATAAAIALAIMVPQAVIAGSQPGVPGRYYLPAVLALVMIGGAVLRAAPSWRQVAATGMILVTLVLGVGTARGMAEERAASAAELGAAVDYIVAWRTDHPQDTLVYAPQVGKFEYEWYAALSIFARFAGANLQPAVTVSTGQVYSAFEVALRRWIERYAPPGDAAEPCLSVQAIGTTPICSDVIRFKFP